MGSGELLTAMRGTESVVDVEDLLHACVASLPGQRNALQLATKAAIAGMSLPGGAS
jgi:hypothetical protein